MVPAGPRHWRGGMGCLDAGAAGARRGLQWGAAVQNPSLTRRHVWPGPAMKGLVCLLRFELLLSCEWDP